jgi:GH25 family lysozyme M1 (1,4-beta-N-acetylmuramidase)
VIRLRRSASIAGSVFVIVGLLAAVAVRTAASAPAALATTTVAGTDVYGLTDVTSWPDVKAAGADFVAIQAYNGATVPNASYGSQAIGALSAGLAVMPYVFADPLKIGGGAQFTKAWSVIDSVTGAPYAPGGQFLPVALDMENDPSVTSKYCYGLTPAQMVSWIKAFVTAAKATSGLAPVIYTSQSWWNQCTGKTAALSADPLWVVDFGVSSPAIPAGWTGYTFWQSSASGSVAGISGPADLDQMQVAPAVTAKTGTSGSAQIETLNSLAGQKVSYARAAALPAGFALSPAGRLSWSTATKAGLYQAAVTPASAADPVVPAVASVTIRVHAAIALVTKKRSSRVGDRVWLKVATSGPDQRAGFAPALKATGLPAGLSMTSAGVISGQPSKRGTFKVTVSATDALGGNGSASFTWTILATAG